uniref:Uncharacterized protein n=1 Tax=Chromera velia CCMP2878 TaxID=1169474 RepID=A0A0G4G2D2_9ALVE|eukprot:Cvel_19852.t1-p1 / transcript=Cvel_19852.t1 / gene=Cvel_19852 / organism=Chromera_velia_CCMP2878 / gene_product=hypothetical protein / transcript_product=hypothetical protein / location=Cvel_scaffold1738:34663-35028(-) / protein_length=122 / sequence_SO=supercontig / SO=protein_coding / is_pseudo=false
MKFNEQIAACPGQGVQTSEVDCPEGRHEDPSQPPTPEEEEETKTMAPPDQQFKQLDWITPENHLMDMNATVLDTEGEGQGDSGASTSAQGEVGGAEQASGFLEKKGTSIDQIGPSKLMQRNE